MKSMREWHEELETMTISREKMVKFETYEMIRESGMTNMCAIKTVIDLSDGELTREDCKDIMANYSVYKKQYEGDEIAEKAEV